MFNYCTQWNDELDNEVKLGVMSGWSVERIAENIGKSYGQVRFRIEKLEKINNEKLERKKMLASTGRLLKNDGSINYISHLKFGD